MIIGWVHYKRSGLFSSEADIAVEGNPYSYKLAPGISIEVTTPVTLLQLRLIRKLAETNRLLTESEIAQLDDLEKKLTTLVQGGFVGSPRRKGM
ncbi:MAG: hypothetical protein ABSF82_07715 [Candidatus Bathyarchaeia archaeon]|jgi:hypothetical protein